LLEGAGDIDENLLALYHVKIFDEIVSLFHFSLTLNRRADKDRAHQAPVAEELGIADFGFKPSLQLELAFDASPFVRR
jgi:hypothetical protein